MGWSNNVAYSNGVLHYFQLYLLGFIHAPSIWVPAQHLLQLRESFKTLLNFCIDRNYEGFYHVFKVRRIQHETDTNVRKIHFALG